MYFSGLITHSSMMRTEINLVCRLTCLSLLSKLHGIFSEFLYLCGYNAYYIVLLHEVIVMSKFCFIICSGY